MPKTSDRIFIRGPRTITSRDEIFDMSLIFLMNYILRMFIPAREFVGFVQAFPLCTTADTVRRSIILWKVWHYTLGEHFSGHLFDLLSLLLL